MTKTLLDQGILALDKLGIFDYILPFMVAFAILYGILDKTNLFGKQNKHLNSIFAAIVSVMILPFVGELNYAVFVSKLMFLIIGFVFLAIVLNMFGYNFQNMSGAIIFAFIAVGFLAATEIFGINFNNVPDVMKYIILAVLVFGALMWYLTKKEPTQSQPPKEKVKKEKKPESEINMPSRRPEINEFIESLKNAPEEEREAILSQMNPAAADMIRKRLK